MRLDWAILSNSSEIQGGLAYVLGGAWDTGWRPIYPAPFAGALTIRVLVHPTEVTAQHQLEIRFWNADGHDFAQPLHVILGPGTVPPDHPTGWEVPALLAISLHTLLIPSEGQYSLEILVDGHHLGSPAGSIQTGRTAGDYGDTPASPKIGPRQS